MVTFSLAKHLFGVIRDIPSLLMVADTLVVYILSWIALLFIFILFYWFKGELLKQKDSQE